MTCQIPTLQQNFRQNYWVTLVTELQFSHSAVKACQTSCSARAGDAIAAAGKLKSMLRLTEIEHELATDTSQESQEHILHSAASILRHDIQSFVINNEDYPNANEVSLAISVEKMPQSLLKFICWLIDEKAYKAASELYTVPIDKIRKILGITESIVSLSKHTFTPFHLGLAVQLHHEFGSRGLVDNLNSHGF